MIYATVSVLENSLEVERGIWKDNVAVIKPEVIASYTIQARIIENDFI